MSENALRKLLSISLVAAVGLVVAVESRADDMPFAVVAAGDGFTNCLSRTDAGWTDGTVVVSFDGEGHVSVRSPGKGLSSVTLNWKKEWHSGAMFLNDAWERSYGELEWRTLAAGEIFSPWYFLTVADGQTSGVGVETQPNAMACWKIAKDGFSLVLDVRAGGRPVRLGDRVLRACRVVRAGSKSGESAWQFGRRFCRLMCPKPKLPKSPVYGYNDWYCAYGKNTATNFLKDAEYVVACAKGCENPPYVVMDDGWQKNSPPVVRESGRGPWDVAGHNFGMDMPEFCRAIAALGAKPGLWYRPLRAWDGLPKDQKLIANEKYLDPTVPSVRSRIVEDMKRFREWGFRLVKIDFLSYDIAQLWPCDPHPHPELFIQDDRAWRDDTRTTAEVMLDLYRAMKDAAGDDVVIIGCNALNHLAAGVFELQRTGNDTSGRDWEWTRKNGVNTLAMRSIQDGAFFKIDADCVGLASEGAVPWSLNRQWMELLGKSGTPMFVSWRRDLATPEVRKAISEAFRLASTDCEAAEPLDWFETRQPRRWRFADGVEGAYEWYIDGVAKEAKTYDKDN
jgi:alpha-galactosidase